MPNARERVLVVEDDGDLASLLADELGDAGYEAETASTAEEAERRLARRPVDLVISDVRLPGASGTELLEHARGLEASPAFIVVTAFGTIRQAVECLKAGADDFLTKPLDLDHLVLSASRALERRRLRDEVKRFRALLEADDFHGMIGRSRSMRSLFEKIARVASADGPALVIGESGVGKEMVARAVHEESPRSSGPFLAVNCAGIPRELLESEFFGHEEGAFTGASRSRTGLFEEADGGTVVLDEVAEMPLELQAKLLRVLQDGTIRRVGSNETRTVDVRVVAATNRDIDEEMREGRFREDLFYRLETFRLEVPPLRERGDDIELLTGHFLRRFAARRGNGVEGISDAALHRLKAYPFPGNVRELENAIERAVTFADGRTVAVDDLPERIRRSASKATAETVDGLVQTLVADGRLPTLGELERHYIRHVLERVEGNKRRAAELLGIGRRTLYRRLEEYAGAGD